MLHRVARRACDHCKAICKTGHRLSQALRPRQQEPGGTLSVHSQPLLALAQDTSSDVLDAHDLLFSASGLHNRKDRLFSWRALFPIRRTSSHLKHPNHAKPKHEAFTTVLPLANSSKISAWIFLSSAAVTSVITRSTSSTAASLTAPKAEKAANLSEVQAAGPTLHTTKLQHNK